MSEHVNEHVSEHASGQSQQVKQQSQHVSHHMDAEGNASHHGISAKAIGAQLYTLRKFMQTPEGISDSLRRVKEMGYDAVQVSGIGPIEPERLQSLVQELNLTICATHIPFDQLQNHLDDVIRRHRLWECRYVGIGSMPQEYQSSREGYERFINEITGIGKRLHDAGLRLVYHNHNFEFEKFDGVPGMQLLLDGAAKDTYSLEIDTYWVQAGGASPVEWIRKASGLVDVIHLKDMAIRGREQLYGEIGEGNFNWTDILRACQESGVEWYVVEQDESTRDAFESLAMSREYLSRFTK